MDSTMPFSVTEQYSYQELLDEAIETILSANAQLGPDEQTPDAALEELVAPLRKLKEAQAFFASALTVQQLSEQDFAKRRLKPAPLIQKWMLTHRLYLIQIPATLTPAIGWSFTRLQCGVVFESVGPGAEPKIHDIYPDDAWSEILRLRTHLTLGLNTELSFRAEAGPIEAAYQALSGEAKARLSASASGGTQLVVGPFNAGIYRPKVLGRGRENSKVFWQLDGDDHVQREEPYLAVVLRVPSEVREINAQGRLITYHRFNFLGTNLADWSGMFREKLRSFFSNGIPLEATAIWKNVIG